MTNTFATRLWDEAPDPRSPFLGTTVRLSGFDYFADLLPNARWSELVWLLFTAEPPTADQSALFERLAVALANPGPRDPAVHAAMCAGIGGSHPAASLMAALAVGAGEQGGSAELRRAMLAWQHDQADTLTLPDALDAQADAEGLWPGFNAHSRHTGQTVLQCLDVLCQSPLAEHLTRLREAEPMLTARLDRGLNLTGVAAAAFVDLGLTPSQAEAIHLLLRLPGALAHALEQSEKSYRDFPFFALTEASADEPPHD